MTRPVIAVTMGDPAGVGPELCLRALNEPEVLNVCHPLVFGDHAILKECGMRLGLNADFPILHFQDKFFAHPGSGPAILDIPALDREKFTPAQVDANTGSAAYAYVQAAIDFALAGSVDAVTTAPLNKEALARAGIHFPGHTEIFAARDGSSKWCMMQYSEEICCSFVTVHVGYSEVLGLLTQERILDVIELSSISLERIRGRKANIVVCGLNPHAGEHGLFGNGEEESIILPAIRIAQARGLNVEGPLPPDTAFLPWKRKTTDVYVCMYHDQGHIPVKVLAFDNAVNTTLGLSIIRTSVDHGTALDIAWQGKASPGSLFSALKLAARLAAK